MAEPNAPAGNLNESEQEKKHLAAVLGWANDALSEGESFLKSQRGYDQIGVQIDYIMGDYSRDMIPGSFSKLVDNRFGKIALDFAGAMTDIKPFWEYKTENKRFEQQQVMAGKLTKGWWTRRLIDLKFTDCIKYAEVAGSGYPHLVYSEQIGDNDVIAEDPRDVLPIRPSSNFSLQEAFGVTVRRERPLNYLREKYPRQWASGRIKADRDMSAATLEKVTRAQGVMTRMGFSGFMQNLWASLGGKPQAHLVIPSADVYTMYLKDSRTNDTGSRVWVGEGTPDKHPNWSYWAEPGDQLYPRGRQIIFTRTCMLRDGPNIYWHGLFPLPKITLDPWPWSFLGKPPLLDLITMQDELHRLLRGVSDHNQKVFRPDLVADKNSMSRSAMAAVDTRKAGLKLRTNPVAGKAAEFVYAQPLDQSVQASILDLRDEMDKISGVRDVQQLMNLGQIPASETIEKILETMSPAIRMRSRVLEAGLREFAMMTLSNTFQFVTLNERLALLGPQAMTFEDVDHDPGTMIPAYMTQEDSREGRDVPRHIRARQFLNQFTYEVAPGSLLSASEVTTKLLYIQLFRAGVMDVWTLFEKLGIPNAGSPPDNVITITDRLQAMNQMGLTPQVSATGRKASGQTMPTMKPGGNIVESK
jgi:hypothetical protein